MERKRRWRERERGKETDIMRHFVNSKISPSLTSIRYDVICACEWNQVDGKHHLVLSR